MVPRQCLPVITTAVLGFAVIPNVLHAATIYDFSTSAGIDRFAFGNAVPAAPTPPTTNTIPSIAFGPADYAAASSSDDSRYGTGVIEGGNAAATRFVFSIAEVPATITQIDVLWEGGADQGAIQFVWLWNATTGSYSLAGSQTGAAPPDGTVASTITNAPSNYIDAAGNLTILITYSAEGGELLTDYLSVTITGPQCSIDADCDDGLACNGSETCQGALRCQAGTPINCDDGIACTVDSCVDPLGTCDPAPDHTACDNGTYCDGIEICDPASGCLGGTAVDCDDAIACTTDTCNELGDYCDHTPDAPDCLTPARWYVKGDATGTNDGTSWLNAFTTLQDALSASVHGDEIWTAAGTYKPDEGVAQTLGDAAASFVLRNGVAVSGHFLGTETSLVERHLTDPADPLRRTTLSGDLGVLGDAVDNSIHVVAVSGVDNTTLLDGFTVRDGSAWDVLSSGGGLYIGTGSPTISNCTFTANNAGAGGGGIYNAGGTPTIRNCTLTGNTADFGGGMANSFGNPRIIDTTFIANEADALGGGLADIAGHSTLTNCQFLDNFTVVFNGMGGGVFTQTGGTATLTNCLFTGNTSDHGGGMFAWGASTITNSTFYQNHGSFDNGGFGTVSVAPSLVNCILWENTGTGTIERQQLATVAQINYCSVQGWTGTAGGIANTGDDPLFADPIANDFRLATGSPCVDAGSNAAVPPAVTTDLDGNPRIVGPAVDRGVYESQTDLSPIPTVSQWGLIAMSLMLLTAGSAVVRHRPVPNDR